LELGRRKSAEILKREKPRETEKWCVFTFGMLIYAILMKQKLFHKDNDEVARQKIIIGEKSDLSFMEDRKCEFVSIMRDCSCEESDSRL
jgi:hypothetical protein